MNNTDNNPVLFYEREFYVFSNFSSFNVEWKGTLWTTSEHAYQAAHFTDKKIIEAIRDARSAHDAMKLARANQDKKRADWKEIKLAVMEDIVRAKLAQHAYIQKKLLQTGTREIIENSPKDGFWGWGPNRDGHNHLGKIWMELREELESSIK